MELFEVCSEINDLLIARRDVEARGQLITLLDYHVRHRLEYTPLLNAIIRETGLYPYVKPDTAAWQERFVYEAFKVEAGDDEPRTLHKEQSTILKRLLEGESIAVSAPTSFGKTFIIDAFISIRRPQNVVIIVPTIALMDEVRRRLFRKFGATYKVITTTDATLGERNLFVFPQERAVAYLDQLETIDLLVVDEFYKASSAFDRERSPALLKAILHLQRIAKQRYFLAPNIRNLIESPFTKGMDFVDKLDFSTVVLREHHLYEGLHGDEAAKGRELLRILSAGKRKTLIYAASYTEISKVTAILVADTPAKQSPLLTQFSEWLGESYGPHWILTKLVTRGAGVHNGQIHRALSQIQLRLFEEEDGLDTIVSTSSIIEGVNTCAESVVLWKNRKGGKGNPYLDAFTYRNIIGRGGRMFKYFVGQVYLLEKPPESRETQLEIEFPDNILGGLDEEVHRESLSDDQITKIISFRERMIEILGDEFVRLYRGPSSFQTSDSDLILKIAEDMAGDPSKWNGLNYLNSANTAYWERHLYNIIGLQPGGWDIEYRKFVRFVRVLSKNWEWDLPRILRTLETIEVDVDLFFKLERNVSFKMASLLHDVNEIQKAIFNNGVDVSGFVSKLAHAFLPSVVYQLEEFGLPRMIARKIHNSGVIDFEREWPEINAVLEALRRIGRQSVIRKSSLSSFETYVVNYFFDGIEFQSPAPGEGSGARNDL